MPDQTTGFEFELIRAPRQGSKGENIHYVFLLVSADEVILLIDVPRQPVESEWRVSQVRAERRAGFTIAAPAEQRNQGISTPLRLRVDGADSILRVRKG